MKTPITLFDVPLFLLDDGSMEWEDHSTGLDFHLSQLANSDYLLDVFQLNQTNPDLAHLASFDFDNLEGALDFSKQASLSKLKPKNKKSKRR
jgi:NADPH-dependent glutamate synthase beta subunit-like oxidoreductase